jgi:hypothetical protein
VPTSSAGPSCDTKLDILHSIYTQGGALDGPCGTAAKLADGTQPDWQPLPL